MVRCLDKEMIVMKEKVYTHRCLKLRVMGRSRVGQEVHGQGEGVSKAFIVVFTAKKG